MRKRFGACALMAALCAAGVFPARSLAATASIEPSQLAAGTTVTVTVTAPQCSADDVILGGDILAGPADLTDSGHPATHQFQGQVEVAAGAGSGAHALSVRCGGGDYGSVHVTVTGGQHGSGGGGSSTAALTLQLGKTYAHAPGAADGDVVGQPFTIPTADCPSALARTVVFPDHAGIYNADGDGYDAGAEFRKLGQILSDSHGVYVSPELQPGTTTEHLACENAFGTVLSHFTLHVHFVRTVLAHYRSKLSPGGAFQALKPGLNGIDAGGLGSELFVSVPACRDPKALLTLSSPGLMPHTVTAQNHDIGVTDFEGWETKFAFSTLTAVSAPGAYPETISCGSGTIATGTLSVG